MLTLFTPSPDMEKRGDVEKVVSSALSTTIMPMPETGLPAVCVTFELVLNYFFCTILLIGPN